MSKHVVRDSDEAELPIEDGFVYKSSIRVQYYRSFEYCWKWKMPVYTRGSSRSRKRSREEFQGSLIPKEESVHHKRAKKKQKRAPRKTQDEDSESNTDEESDRDILSALRADEGWCPGVADEEEDLSDEDCGSIASGPTVLHGSPARSQSPSQGLCSTCWNLYEKAKKMKSPIKNKLLDNDPESPTCDQWVLLKHWRPRRVSHTRGKLLTHLRLVKKRLVRLDLKKTNGLTRAQEQPDCLRQHVFLQRNLKGVSVKPGRKRSKRKRPREDSLRPPVAKQQRLTSSDLAQHRSKRSSLSPTSGFDGWSVQESDGPEDMLQTAERISSSVDVSESLKPQKVRVKPNAPKKTAGFRDLLAQMRANANVIVRETC